MKTVIIVKNNLEIILDFSHSKSSIDSNCFELVFTN